MSIIFVLASVFTVFVCDAQTNNNEANNGVAWMEAYSGLFPYLIALFFVVFSLHQLLYSQYATVTLMKQYISNNIVRPGHVLSYDEKRPEEYEAEIMYQAKEHKYCDNPSFKFRFPRAYETKNFFRRFDFHRSLTRGESIEVLLSDKRWPRSGIPREIVLRYLAGYDDLKYTKCIQFVGLLLCIVIIALAIREVTIMEESLSGYIALFIGIVVIELVSFLYSADQFLKKKRNRFDSAKPMIETKAQAKNLAEKPPPSLDPNWKGFHNFAGHARADIL